MEILGLPLEISIHALREEGDHAAPAVRHPLGNFYPRPPRGGRPPISTICTASCKFLSTPSARRATDEIAKAAYWFAFLSTPSARRATLCRSHKLRHGKDFYPRPPRGGRPLILFFRFPCVGISIHALREEGDDDLRRGTRTLWNFYPRPPRGGRLYVLGTVAPY